MWNDLVQRLEYESPQPKKPPFGSWKICWGFAFVLALFLFFVVLTIVYGCWSFKHHFSGFMTN
jgi:hypothetical protein